MIKIKNLSELPLDWGEELDKLSEWKSSADKIIQEHKAIKDNDIDEKLVYNNKNGIWKKLKPILMKLQQDKCGYCERSKDIRYEADVEHFRPKKKPEEADENHDGYWWLAYDINNYLFVCPTCNRKPNKGEQFPLLNSKKHCNNYNEYFQNPNDYFQQIDTKEEPVLINPLKENPELFFAYNFNNVLSKAYICSNKGLSELDAIRSNETIRILGLNDIDKLNELRFEIAKQIDLKGNRLASILTQIQDNVDPEVEVFLQKRKKELSEEILNETSSQRELTGIRRYVIRNKSFLLSDYISDD